MKTKDYRWKMVGRVEPKGEGQRIFVRVRRDSDWTGPIPADVLREADLYVADNSGRDPDNTDDGPLLLVREKPLRVGHWCGRIGVDATVKVERNGGENSRCGFTIREAAWLVQTCGMRVEVEDPGIQDLLAAHGALASAAEAGL
jgi:hypothetical protein